MPLHPFLVITKLYRPFIAILKPLGRLASYFDFLNFAAINRSKGSVNDYYNSKAGYQDRFILHDHILKAFHEIRINYFEFGVAGGDMIRYWSEANNNSDSIFIGFDSFEGLPESWEEKEEGHFDQGGQVPQIDDPRVTFVKGWFDKTVYKTLQTCRFDGQSIFHFDADLFSSTLYVLFHIQPFLKSGDVLIFDEYSSFEHEHHAFKTFQRSCPGIKFRFLDAINNYRQVAFKID